MQIPILNGIFTNEDSDFRVAYPFNKVPVILQNGISNGYLRPTDGIKQLGSNGPGIDRGGINWNGICYRVMGSKFVSVSSTGVITEIGDVGDNGKQVSMDYSFSNLGIVSNNNFFLYNGSTLQQVTDPDLGEVFDVIWIDGYFMLTDGENLIVTELNDPTQINPLKYGSSEVDPDPILGLLKLKNEAYVLNRHTIEVFDNIGSTGFPFQRIDGAQIEGGSIGTHTCFVFEDTIAFMGNNRHNESISVHLAVSGSSTRIATREIDQILNSYSSEVLAHTSIEPRIDDGHQHLFIHLPNETLVYDANASRLSGDSIWHILGSGLERGSKYRARNLVWCYNKWLVGDTNTSAIGELVNNEFSHWGEDVGWEINTVAIYNDSNGVIFHELELVSLTGRVALGLDDFVSTQYSLDGETWSQEKFIKAGKIGDRNKRLIWLSQGSMRNWRIQRFRGTSRNKLSITRLEVRLEPLSR